MKKAKVFLTALTVLTVVGGALAFKAQKTYGGDLRCTFGIGIPTNQTTKICPLSTYTTIGVTTTAGWCTLKGAASNADCFYTSVLEDL